MTIDSVSAPRPCSGRRRAARRRSRRSRRRRRRRRRRGRRCPARGRGRSRASTSALRSSSSRGQSFPWIAPPRHLIAAAEITPSGVPPMPISMSTPVPAVAAAIDGATSPSVISAPSRPASRSSRDQLLVAVAVEDDHADVLRVHALRLRDRGGRSRPAARRCRSRRPPPARRRSCPCRPPRRGRTSCRARRRRSPRSRSAWPSAVSRVPSSGSTATSTAGPWPLPTPRR